jgi:hypothetical protein
MHYSYVQSSSMHHGGSMLRHGYSTFAATAGTGYQQTSNTTGRHMMMGNARQVSGTASSATYSRGGMMQQSGYANSQRGGHMMSIQTMQTMMSGTTMMRMGGSSMMRQTSSANVASSYRMQSHMSGYR